MKPTLNVCLKDWLGILGRLRPRFRAHALRLATFVLWRREVDMPIESVCDFCSDREVVCLIPAQRM
jgi:hypothetical protein